MAAQTIPPEMSPILALDASCDRCSVALGEGSRRIDRECDTPRAHAQVMLPMVDEVLAAANFTLADMKGVAVSLGPGSFTGIRIGLGLAQGLAFGAGLPLFGCDSLALLAQGIHLHRGAQNRLVIAALDARMAEIYWAAYTHNGDHLINVQAPRVSSPEDFNRAVAALAEQYSMLTVCGGGHGWSVSGVDTSDLDLLPDLLPRASEILDLLSSPTLMQPLDPMLVEPLYLRNEVTWEKRKRVRDGAH